MELYEEYSLVVFSSQFFYFYFTIQGPALKPTTLFIQCPTSILTVIRVLAKIFTDVTELYEEFSPLLL